MARTAPCRRFNVVDGMILIAATALAIFLTRFIFVFESDSGFVRLGRWDETVWSALKLSELWLFAATLAIVAIRLRRPRLPVRRLVWQPGFGALAPVALVGLCMIALGLVVAGIAGVLNRFTEDWPWYVRLHFETHLGAGWAVAAVWLIQRLGRRCRPEPGWIDGSGRIIGFAWIVWVAVDYLMLFS